MQLHRNAVEAYGAGIWWLLILASLILALVHFVRLLYFAGTLASSTSTLQCY